MKKDQNYIANLEKAIARKYGKEAVQNPKASWSEEKEKQYNEQLKRVSLKEQKLSEKKEKVEINGFLVSKKLLNKESNRTCPVCKVYSFNSQDDIYMNRYDCCHKCYVQWVEFREERWASGWRPNKEENK